MTAVTALAALVAATIWAMGLNSITPPSATPATLSASAPAKPTSSEIASAPTNVAVVGDSFAAGAGAPGSPTWVDRLADTMCLNVAWKSAEDATGYTTAGLGATPRAAPYPARVANIGAADAQLILIEGGVADQDAPSQQIVNAASETFKVVRNAVSPKVPVIAVGPVAAPAADADALARVAAAISFSAARLNVRFINPIQGKWLNSPEFWNADGVHPNARGYDEYATRLGAELERIGAAKPCKRISQ